MQGHKRRQAGRKLVYSEEVQNRLEAREREKYFKSGIGREYLKRLVP